MTTLIISIIGAALTAYVSLCVRRVMAGMKAVQEHTAATDEAVKSHRMFLENQVKILQESVALHVQRSKELEIEREMLRHIIDQNKKDDANLGI